MWRCAWPCVRLLRCPTLYTTRRHCSTAPTNTNTSSNSYSNSNNTVVSDTATSNSLREQLQRLAQETQTPSAVQSSSPAWQRALELMQAGTGSPGDALACNDVAALECVLYICLQNARTLADAQPPAELCRALYEKCHALRCNDSTGGVEARASPAFAPYADLYLSYARQLWRTVCIHSSRVREHRDDDTRTVPLTTEMLRVLLLDAPRAHNCRTQQSPTSLRLVLQGLCELQKYNVLLPTSMNNTTESNTAANTNDVLLLLLSWLRQPCGAADMDDRTAMSNAVRALYTQPWCNADEVALQCVRHTVTENSKRVPSCEAVATSLLLYVHYTLQRMQVHSDELERQVCRLTHTIPQYSTKESPACDGYAEAEQVAPVLQALLTALLQLKHKEADGGDEVEEGRKIQAALLHALVQPLAGRTSTTSTSSTSSPRPRFVLCLWVVRTLLTWLRSAQSELVHPDAHQTDAAMEAAMQTWQRRSERVVYFLRDLLLALPIHFPSNNNNNKKKKSLTRDVRRDDATVQTGQAVWRAVLEAAIEGVFANHAYTPEVRTATTTTTTTDTPCDVVLAAETNTSSTSLVMQELLLPLYDTMHWRWQTVNRYVVLLHQWEQHTALRAVFTYIQGREARAQRRYYYYDHLQQHEVTEREQTTVRNKKDRTKREEVRYRPALTMSSCRHIFAACCSALRDPHTSAELVRYMLLVLRVAQEEAGNHTRTTITTDSSNSDVSEPASDEGKDEEEEKSTQLVRGEEYKEENEEEKEVMVDGEPLRQWLAWISAECIPAVGRLFAERGLDKQGDWLERY